MAHTYDETILSDLHKDAHGFRPRESFWERWNRSTPSEKQVIWDGLLADLDAEMERERRAKNLAHAAWEADIQRLISVGAGDRATAIRWDMAAVDAYNGHVPDVGYYCYLRGIDYGNETEIKRLLAV